MQPPKTIRRLPLTMPRHIVPVILGALLIGAVAFGTAQMAEGKKLRANLTTLDQERIDLRKRIWELQKLNGELAAQREKTAVATDGPVAFSDDNVQADASSPTERPRRDTNRIASFFNTPEVQQLMALQQKAGLDGGYAALFKKLNLSPADLERFKNLLVEKQSAIMDVMAAARSQGLTGRESRGEILKLVQDTQAEIDGNIRATLGDASFTQYKNYEATLPQRGVVSQLEKRLSYSPTPLNDTQAEQLVQILATNAPPASNSGNRADSTALLGQAMAGNPRTAQVAGLFGGAGARITDAAVTQSQGVLAPAQVAALQSLQAEQEAATRLGQQMRNRARTPPKNNTPPPTLPTGPGG
jgi:hypothetical protein